MHFERRTPLISFGQENKKDEAVTDAESMWATILKLCILVSVSPGYVFPRNNYVGWKLLGLCHVEQHELTRT